MNRFFLLSAVLVSTVVFASPVRVALADGPMNSATDISKPILFNLGLTARPWNFTADSIAHIDGLPFSGITYNIPATYTVMNSNEFGPWVEQDLLVQLEDLNFSFENVNENWVSVVVRRNGLTVDEGDFFDDLSWQQTIDQFRLLARVASSPRYQAVGIFFDNEEYFEQVWNYPDDVAHADQYTMQEYQEKSRQRGREVFDAIVSEWPDAKIMFAHGPYLSTPESRPFEVSMNQVAGPDDYELLAPFFYGMVELAEDQQVIDGGEVYQLRNEQQFQINNSWRSTDISQSIVVPESLRQNYAQRIGVTHGLYNLTWPTVEDQMSPEIMRTTLNNALRSSPQNVWIFTEASETWLIPGGFPLEWRTSIENGFADANILRGDANLDGDVNLLDIAPFIELIGSNNFLPEADLNNDGTVDLLDVAPFVDLLSGK